ncbi:hypothetical protein M0813_29649 [Anaeramoeba flamelloides]|uniref:BTB domain-containing protein n=1 Tax=Anaeramoeba flamelloides TaxID=1746091 RepID=A0ABQ8XMB6_9EUKA|nr:hypothetical protein M0813_29649 [Anaeramoeba flamelloides]
MTLNYYISPTTFLEPLGNEDPISGIEFQQDLCHIRNIQGGMKSMHLFQLGDSGLLSFGKQDTKYEQQYETLPNKIVAISSGMYHMLLVDEKGKAYSFSKSNFNRLGQNLEKTIVAYRATLIDYFEENDLFVHDVACCCNSSYFLCSPKKGNETQKEKCEDQNCYSLYSCGWCQFLGLDKEEDGYITFPERVSDNVTRVFSGTYAYNFWYLTQDNKLMGAGENNHTKLGWDQEDFLAALYKPIEVPVNGFKTCDIKDLQGGYQHSLLLTKNGELYGVGFRSSNGLGRPADQFTKIEALNNICVYQMLIFKAFNVILTDQGLYYWGEQCDFTKKKLTSAIPQKLQITESICFEDYNIFTSGLDTFFLIHNSQHQDTIEDLKNLFKSKRLSDDQIFDIPVHKTWVEIRIGKSLNSFKNWIKEMNFKKEQVLDCLNWVYSNKKFPNSNSFKLFLDEFIINKEFTDSTLEQSLTKLYQDEDSKNFSLKVKTQTLENKLKIDPNNEKEKLIEKQVQELELDQKQKQKQKQEQEEEEEEEEEEEQEQELSKEFEEIRVHDFLLFARSGLFRAFFDFTNEKEKQITNQVQDYSGKSLATLKIFIKYLYTGKIELTKDNENSKSIAEELQDANEYYQLNTRSGFLLKLNKIKKELNLD